MVEGREQRTHLRGREGQEAEREGRRRGCPTRISLRLRHWRAARVAEGKLGRASRTGWNCPLSGAAGQSGGQVRLGDRVSPLTTGDQLLRAPQGRSGEVRARPGESNRNHLSGDAPHARLSPTWPRVSCEARHAVLQSSLGQVTLAGWQRPCDSEGHDPNVSEHPHRPTPLALGGQIRLFLSSWRPLGQLRRVGDDVMGVLTHRATPSHVAAACAPPCTAHCCCCPGAAGPWPRPESSMGAAPQISLPRPSATPCSRKVAP